MCSSDLQGNQGADTYILTKNGGQDVIGNYDSDSTVDVAKFTDVATTDVGSHKLLVGQGWTSYAPKALLMTNGLSSMGYSLPAAIAAKLVHPERPVACFTGDGGLAMVQGELRLAASLGVDPLVVVFCDDSLNRIEIKDRKSTRLNSSH